MVAEDLPARDRVAKLQVELADAADNLANAVWVLGVTDLQRWSCAAGLMVELPASQLEGSRQHVDRSTLSGRELCVGNELGNDLLDPREQKTRHTVPVFTDLRYENLPYSFLGMKRHIKKWAELDG